jgi:hypothetical protein
MRKGRVRSPMRGSMALRLALVVLSVLSPAVSAQAPRERCMINFLDGCKLHRTYAGLADDSAAAYDHMGVGQSEERCLKRAREYFEWCSNELHQQVMCDAQTSSTSKGAADRLAHHPPPGCGVQGSGHVRPALRAQARC